MDADQVKRNDFPNAADGYDRSSVDAHLAAVAAQITALEARITSYEVERDALRRQIGEAEPAAPAPTPSPEAPAPEAQAPAEPAAPTEPPAPSAAPAGDEVSARLLATKMALDGTDRETIRLRLADGYDVEDLDVLLDDVIERVG